MRISSKTTGREIDADGAGKAPPAFLFILRGDVCPGGIGLTEVGTAVATLAYREPRQGALRRPPTDFQLTPFCREALHSCENDGLAPI